MTRPATVCTRKPPRERGRLVFKVQLSRYQERLVTSYVNRSGVEQPLQEEGSIPVDRITVLARPYSRRALRGPERASESGGIAG